MTRTSAVTGSSFDLHLPRILCLHGGGTNARIFRAQCRRLIAELKSEFRLVFAEAPFDSSAGSDVLSVYREWGPFKRWLRWRPEQPQFPHEVVIKELDRALENTMRKDDALGATGEWIAILGFSQGAKIAASLLYRQQIYEAQRKSLTSRRFRFGILMAGRAPLVLLQESGKSGCGLPNASHMTTADDFSRYTHNGEHVLRVPTAHVHGLLDKGLDLHRQLYGEFCAPESRKLVEWDGDHRVPLKVKDVTHVASHVRQLARETGVY